MSPHREPDEFLDDDDLTDSIPADLEEDIEAAQDDDFGDETQRNQERNAEEGIEGTPRVRRQERESEEDV